MRVGTNLLCLYSERVDFYSLFYQLYRRYIMYPQSAKQALAQLQSIPTINQDYSSFRFSRLFHYDHLELEGFSISENCWVTLWSIHNLA
jgi:hypothetical protein